jgi:hypothetical protein
MMMDPVMILAEELRAAESALDKATQIYNRDGQKTHGELVNVLLAKVKRLFAELFQTEPTSAIGAGELVRLAAQRLPFAYARHAAQLHEIADRLADGQRKLSDLVWLRAMQAALSDGFFGKEGERTARLLNLAIAGARRPVMVFHAVQPPLVNAPWRGIIRH